MGLAAQHRLQFVQRDLAGGMTSALEAIVGMTPRMNEPRPGRIEQHSEFFTVVIEVQSEVRTPLGGHRMLLHFDPFEDPTEALPISVEHPSAVARLQYELPHTGKSASAS
jgi:hypothetical protein